MSVPAVRCEPHQQPAPLSFQQQPPPDLPGWHSFIELRQRAQAFVGVVQMQDGSTRRYTLLRSKRHDPEALAHALGELGWERTEVWRFGPDPGRHALLLLRRV